MSPRLSPDVNHVDEMNCNYVVQASEPIYISQQAYVIVRPESLSVEGQEPDFVPVLCGTVIKYKHHRVQTDQDE